MDSPVKYEFLLVHATDFALFVVGTEIAFTDCLCLGLRVSLVVRVVFLASVREYMA